MTDMANAAYQAYHALVFETPGFLDYWKAVTPLEEITRLSIGSRPAARKAGQFNVEKIRAIPWVFSWMQSRFNLPGWYGLGAGLLALGAKQGKPAQVVEKMYREWPFFRTLLDNAEMSLMKADMGIARLYSELAPEQEFAEKMFRRIEAEFERTRSAILSISGHKDLLDEEPVIQRSIHLRNPYVDPLNYIQIELLRRLRALPNQVGPEAESLREAIVLTVNGIAAGLRNTG
jgi:phosphoenolpyruvate carboxylase